MRLKLSKLIFIGIISLTGKLKAVDDECVDRPHYYYKCSQLAKYCKYPQATRIRKSCPVTCGICGNDEMAVLRTITFDSNQIGIIKPMPVEADLSQRDLSVVAPSFTKNGPSDTENRRSETENRLSVTENRRSGTENRQGATKDAWNRRNGDPRELLPEVLQPAVTFRPQPSTMGNWGPKTSWNGRPLLGLIPTESPRIQRRPAPPPFIPPPPPPPIQQEKQRGSLERPNRHAVSDPEALSRLEGCCRMKGISFQCLSLCTYRTTKREILAKAVSGSCTMSDARVWVQCAAGGQRNQACCARSGVSGCDELCNGQFPQNFNQLLNCVNQYLDPILRCHKSNLKP